RFARQPPINSRSLEPCVSLGGSADAGIRYGVASIALLAPEMYEIHSDAVTRKPPLGYRNSTISTVESINSTKQAQPYPWCLQTAQVPGVLSPRSARPRSPPCCI